MYNTSFVEQIHPNQAKLAKKGHLFFFFSFFLFSFFNYTNSKKQLREFVCCLFSVACTKQNASRKIIF